MRVRTTKIERGNRMPFYVPLSASDNALKLLNSTKYVNSLMIELLEERAAKVYGKEEVDNGKTSEIRER